MSGNSSRVASPVCAPDPPNDPRGPAGAFTVQKLAEAVKGTVEGRADLTVRSLTSLDTTGDAARGALTFIRGGKFALLWASSSVAAALVSKGIDVPGHDPSTRALIRVDNADWAMAQVLGLFAPPTHGPADGVHPTAIIDPTAHLGKGCKVGAYCIIGPRTRVGDGCTLHPRVTLGAEVVVGPLTTLFPGVTIYDRCTIGAKCALHAHVVIGADGFGYLPDPQGRGLVKIPHIGTVEVGNGVEIGASSCIDRGKFGATLIGDGTKIDNHVQIGHNCRIGRACIICGMTGIAGSSELGDGAVIAGHVGICDNVKIGARATIAAKSAVMGEVPAGETWSGYPAAPHWQQLRAWAATRTLAGHLKELRYLMRLASRDGASSDE